MTPATFTRAHAYPVVASTHTAQVSPPEPVPSKLIRFVCPVVALYHMHVDHVPDWASGPDVDRVTAPVSSIDGFEDPGTSEVMSRVGIPAPAVWVMSFPVPVQNAML